MKNNKPANYSKAQIIARQWWALINIEVVGDVVDKNWIYLLIQLKIIVTPDMQAALSADAIVDRNQETIGESIVGEQAIYDFDEFTVPLSVSHVQEFCVTDGFGWYLVVKTQKTGV